MGIAWCSSGAEKQLLEKKKKMNMPKWEYKVVWIGLHGHDSFLWKTDDDEVFTGKWSELPRQLERYGDDGWELVSDMEGVFRKGMRSRLIFKRPQ